MSLTMDAGQALTAISQWAALSWILMHGLLLNQGFVLRRRGYSTDTKASFYIALTSTIWSMASIWNAIVESTGKTGPAWVFSFLSEMSKGPILPTLVSGFWLIAWLDSHHAERWQRLPHLWSLSRVVGPFNWRSDCPPMFVWSLNVLAFTCTVVVALAAIFEGDSLNGVLHLIGITLFLSNGAADNPFTFAPHKYPDDRLRVALATSHHEGTVYVLPCVDKSFDAVWSPKIQDEHLAADREIMPLFRHIRSGKYALSEPLERVRTTLVAYQKRVRVTSAQLHYLAAWIYVDPDIPFYSSRSMRAVRAQGTNLLGRELIYALCHAEYLVFMGQGRLPEQVQRHLGRLRSLKRSGAGRGGREIEEAIGFKPGLQGFQEAVRHIYAIFDEEIDSSTYEFRETLPPAYSVALSKTPASIEEYVIDLWDTSCAHSESTFTAMYFFSLIWSMELGNLNGFHLFPVRCRSRHGDLVSQEVVWRQAWYTTLIAQLLINIPLLIGAFGAGLI